MKNINYKNEILKILEEQSNGNYSNTFTKYSYINGAKDFVRFTRNPNYIAYNGEMKLLKLIAPIILNLQELNIYDLGPGDGSKAKYLLNRLENVSMYVGIDISQNMLDIARLKKQFKKLQSCVCRFY